MSAVELWARHRAFQEERQLLYAAGLLDFIKKKPPPEDFAAFRKAQADWVAVLRADLAVLHPPKERAIVLLAARKGGATVPPFPKETREERVRAHAAFLAALPKLSMPQAQEDRVQKNARSALEAPGTVNTWFARVDPAGLGLTRVLTAETTVATNIVTATHDRIEKALREAETLSLPLSGFTWEWDESDCPLAAYRGPE